MRNEGLSHCAAAARFHVPKSTLFDRVRYKRGLSTIGKPQLLSEAEEQTIIDKLFYFADLGVLLSRGDVAEAISLLVKGFSEVRKGNIPLLNRHLGRDFMHRFAKRHKSALKFCVPEYHEAERHAAVNTGTLISQVAKVEKLVQ